MKRAASGIVAALAAVLVLAAPAAAAPAFNLELPSFGPAGSPTARLGRAACLAHADAVKKELAAKADPNGEVAIYDVEGGALFLLAACPTQAPGDDEARAEIARILLDAGAGLAHPGSIRFRDGNVGMPPHVAAAYMQRARLLETLLDRGAAVDDGDLARDGSALLWAAERHCLACVPVLTRFGAQIDRRNRMGLTALFVAAGNGDAAMVEKLVELGASPFAKESAGRSVLDAASTEGVRNVLVPARRRVVATYAAWGAAAALVLAAGLFRWLRRENG